MCSCQVVQAAGVEHCDGEGCVHPELAVLGDPPTAPLLVDLSSGLCSQGHGIIKNPLRPSFPPPQSIAAKLSGMLNSFFQIKSIIPI